MFKSFSKTLVLTLTESGSEIRPKTLPDLSPKRSPTQTAGAIAVHVHSRRVDLEESSNPCCNPFNNFSCRCSGSPSGERAGKGQATSQARRRNRRQVGGGRTRLSELESGGGGKRAPPWSLLLGRRHNRQSDGGRTVLGRVVLQWVLLVLFRQTRRVGLLLPGKTFFF